MEPLFKTKSQYTFEEYKKFNRAIMKKNHVILVNAVLTILLLLCGIILKNLYIIIFAILYPIIYIVLIKRNIKKIYHSSKIIQEAQKTEFDFFEDHFEQKDAMSNVKLAYDKLSDIIETETNFYLMIAKNQGFILVKENFPEGLEEFLRNKR